MAEFTFDITIREGEEDNYPARFGSIYFSYMGIASEFSLEDQHLSMSKDKIHFVGMFELIISKTMIHFISEGSGRGDQGHIVTKYPITESIYYCIRKKIENTFASL